MATSIMWALLVGVGMKLRPFLRTLSWWSEMVRVDRLVMNLWWWWRLMMVVIVIVMMVVVVMVSLYHKFDQKTPTGRGFSPKK